MRSIKSIGLLLAAALIGMITLAGAANVEQPAKIEYRALRRTDVEKLANPKDKNIEGMRTDALEIGLNQLGADGWELAAIEPYHSTSQKTFAPGIVDGKEDPNTGIREVTLMYPVTYVFKRSK